MQEIQNMFTNKTTHHIWLVSPLDSIVQSTMFHLEHLLITCHRTHVALCRFKHYNWFSLVLFGFGNSLITLWECTMYITHYSLNVFKNHLHSLVTKDSSSDKLTSEMLPWQLALNQIFRHRLGSEFSYLVIIRIKIGQKHIKHRILGRIFLHRIRGDSSLTG